jgi:hypothetical protein
MSDHTVPLDHDAISGLLNDPAMIRVVTVVNLTSLSILELLEYGINRRDVSRAMARGVIEFDKPSMQTAPETVSKGDVVQHVLETGDYFFGLLSSKVKLTKLGLYILEIVQADEMQAMGAADDLPEPEEVAGSPFSESAPHL